MAKFNMRRAVAGVGEAIANVGDVWFRSQIGQAAQKSLMEFRAMVDADRDARIRESATERQEREFEFRTGEREAGQEFSAGEKALDRGQRADESAAREAQSVQQHEERMSVLNKQLVVQERSLARQYALDNTQSTALTTNVNFLVEQGIAKDAAGAFELLRRRMERSPTQTTEQFALQLMRSGEPRYRGQGGQQRAVEDAKSIIGKIREGDERDFAAGYEGATSSGSRQRRPLDAFAR